MNMYFYDNCRQFLEKMIQENPTSVELVKAYANLISKVADIEMKYSEHNTDFNKNRDKNQAEIVKTQHTAQADITKKQIEKGTLPLPYGQ